MEYVGLVRPANRSALNRAISATITPAPPTDGLRVDPNCIPVPTTVDQMVEIKGSALIKCGACASTGAYTFCSDITLYCTPCPCKPPEQIIPQCDCTELLRRATYQANARKIMNAIRTWFAHQIFAIWEVRALISSTGGDCSKLNVAMTEAYDLISQTFWKMPKQDLRLLVWLLTRLAECPDEVPGRIAAICPTLTWDASGKATSSSSWLTALLNNELRTMQQMSGVSRATQYLIGRNPTAILGAGVKKYAADPVVKKWEASDPNPGTATTDVTDLYSIICEQITCDSVIQSLNIEIISHLDVTYTKEGVGHPINYEGSVRNNSLSIGSGTFEYIDVNDNFHMGLGTTKFADLTWIKQFVPMTPLEEAFIKTGTCDPLAVSRVVGKDAVLAFIKEVKETMLQSSGTVMLRPRNFFYSCNNGATWGYCPDEGIVLMNSGNDAQWHQNFGDVVFDSQAGRKYFRTANGTFGCENDDCPPGEVIDSNYLGVPHEGIQTNFSDLYQANIPQNLLNQQVLLNTNNLTIAPSTQP